VRSKPDTTSEILFVPTMLFEEYVTMVKARRIKAIMEKLEKAFPTVSKMELRGLADSGCQTR